MCDVRLFKSAYLDYQAALTLYKTPFPDEMFLNIAAYHLQQCVEKTLKGALECVGVTVPNTHRIPKLLQMVIHNGANVKVTEWVDDHALAVQVNRLRGRLGHACIRTVFGVGYMWNGIGEP